MMIACFVHNIVNVALWCGLAYHFGHWWIALFAIFTMTEYRRHVDDGGDSNATD